MAVAKIKWETTIKEISGGLFIGKENEKQKEISGGLFTAGKYGGMKKILTNWKVFKNLIEVRGSFKPGR